MRKKLSKRSEELLARTRERDRAREGFWVRFGCGGALGFVAGIGAVFGTFPRPRRIGHAAAHGLLENGWLVLAIVVAATFLGAFFVARGSDDDLIDFVETLLSPGRRSPRPRLPQSMERPSAPDEEATPRDERRR